jgi:hypothetical protein
MKTDLLAGPLDRHNDRHNKMIESTLRAIGNATPEPGIEGRVAIHIARARQSGLPSMNGGFSFRRMAMAGVSCGLVCAAIVAGSIHHSHAILPAVPGADLPLSSPSGGLGAASAAHRATQQVAPSGRPRAVRKPEDGRATVSPDGKKRAGETIPQQP